MAREAEFKVLASKDGGDYWHLQAANNEIVCWSGQTFTTKESCIRGARWVKDNAADAEIYDYTGEAS